MLRGEIVEVTQFGFFIDSKDIFCISKKLPGAEVGMIVDYEVEENKRKKEFHPNNFIATKVKLIDDEGAQNSTTKKSSSSEISETDLKIGGFFCEDGSIPNYFISNLDNENHKSVKVLGEILSKKGIKPFAGEKKADDALTITQVRNFYHYFQQIYDRKLEPKQTKIALLMMKSNIEYTARRKHLRRFATMMHSRIEILVKSDDAVFNANLEAFKLHFEAFVAYFPRN